MKTIYRNIIAAVAVLLAAATGASAQESDYQTANGIGFSKTVSGPVDGKYTISMDVFATGERSYVEKSVPADIVLVLDVSGSMKDEISSETKYTALESQGYSYNGYGSKQYYYLYNGNYYRVNRGYYSGFFGANTTYYLYFTINSRNYYLTGTGTSTTRPSNSSQTNTIWTGILYERETITTTKMDALKNAVSAFINEIHENDIKDASGNIRVDEDGNPKPLGNQISIVKFGTNSYYNSTTNATITPGNHYVTKSNGSFRNYTTTYSGSNLNCTEVLVGFTATSSESNVETIKTAVKSLVPAGATSADMGMNLARLLVNSLGEDRSESNKTIVFFTDGEPNHQSGFDDTVANSAIKYSNQIKSIGDEDSHPTVYSIGVFDSVPTDGSNIFRYMNYISSNYPEATSMTAAGTKKAETFYMDASSGEVSLEDIFKTIAAASGGTDATADAGAIVAVDVVSNSFSLPEGADESSITVYLEQCSGGTSKDNLTFTRIGNVAQIDTLKDKVKKEIGTDANGNAMISVTGFDYVANWCGLDETSSTGYHGNKLTIEIPIVVNEDAVGGKGVYTNAPESGIYVDGEKIASFPRPVLDLPVQIWIQKAGLFAGESATFTVGRRLYEEYAEGDEQDDSKWQKLTTVSVTATTNDSSAEAPTVKLTGLSPIYVYRIMENGWSWSYKVQTGDGILTSYGVEVNPFRFDNGKTTTEIKYSEAKVRNDFGAGTSTPISSKK